MKGKSSRAGLLLFLFTLYSSPFTFAAETPEHTARYHALINELRCLVCQNQSIAESNAPLAADLREQVRGQIEAGRSDPEIVQYLTDRYGDFVMYRPPFKSKTWLLWLGPFAVLALAGTVAFVYIRRSRSMPDPSPHPSPLEGEGGREAPGEGVPIPDSRFPIPVFAFISLGLLVFAGVWYALAGSWRTQALVNLSKTNPEAARAVSVDGMLEKLRARLEENPGDAEAWTWMGRSAMRRERYAEAAQAFAKANLLTGSQDPDVLVEEGEALAYVHGRSLAGVPAERFSQALALAPNHPRALWFSGLAAMHGGEERAALKHWELLLQQDLPEDVRASLDQSVAEIRQRLGIPAPKLTALTKLALRVDVSLAPELSADLHPGDTLLVYAQEAGGPKMPLAVQRLSASQLPLTVILDDSHSMVPSRKLSAAKRWRLLARVSSSGNAQPQPGDLQGELEVSREQAGQTHKLLISRRL